MCERMLLALVGVSLLAVPWAPAHGQEDPAAVSAPESAAAAETAARDSATIASATARAATASSATGEVARAVFARDVQDREPVDPFTRLPAGESRVFFFTELVGLQGETVHHVWRHRGETMADVTFEVRGPRWRVYSSKNLLPGWDGEWQVQVLTGDGRILHQDAFAVAPTPSPGPEDAAPAAADTDL